MDTHISLTESQLLEALRNADASRPGGADGFTTPELGAALGWGHDKVRAALHRLKAQGLIEPTRVVRETLSGQIQTVPGYRLVQREAA